LKTFLKPDYNKVTDEIKDLLPGWYLQSYLLGIDQLKLGYRNDQNQVVKIADKNLKDFLFFIRRCIPSFDPAVYLGRVHAIVSELLKYFRRPGLSVSAQDRFELRYAKNGTAKLVRVTNPDRCRESSIGTNYPTEREGSGRAVV
jgi:hypothetical protein